MKKFPVAVYESALEEHGFKYFKKWGERFKFFKTLSLFALLFTIIISVLFFADGMTYDNIQMLANVIDSEYNSSFSDESFGVTYNSDSTSVFAPYDKNLIVATSSEVSLYNMYGRKLYSYQTDYENPFIVSSDSLYIVYDLGGKKFSVYNKTGQIYENSNCEYAIVSAAASDSGRFCISTKSRENTTSVLVYNKKCKLIGKYENGRHLSSLAISDNGEYLAISTLTAENGNYNSVLSVYKIDRAELVYTVTNRNKLPLKTFFARSNRVVLCCDDEFFVYNKKGIMESSYVYNAEQLSGISFNGDDKLALSFSYENSNTKSYMNIVDTSGRVIYNNLNMDRISHMVFSGDDLCVLQNDAIMICDGKREATIPLDYCEDVKELITVDDKQILIAYSSHSTVKNIE